METTETIQTESRDECVIEMPLGLMGLEQYKRFLLVSDPAEEPFLWLQAIENPTLAFLVMSPFVALQTYQPELADEDVDFLALQGPEDTLIFSIVTLKQSQQATANLKGPIVLNRRTLKAKQIIPVNGADYSVAHPLPVQPN